jgi:DEAD/DEAH box helicase domain-containing protein
VRHIITFDVETQYTADEVGGWGNIIDMRLAAAVTYDSASNVYRDYTEHEVDQLVTTLQCADMVVGYNVLRFDYQVLARYTDAPLSELRTADMLQHLYRVLGWRPKLDAVAAATLGEKKSANGLQAVRWFREGKLDKVIAYCHHDVEVTWKLYEFGRQNGYVRCRDKRWHEHTIPVRW